ncbi:DHA2 family efflux MFS transporter permease subunit [Tsukamurella sp. 8F]|uniref:DHA2 family efflux MFS transporter permease subunit n=1 Tax=unclassified Tsukamurella TaxID=2633480 RepID=UPI0023B8A4F5|nr:MULTISPECIES: DHA2 family efflux MFS transporter permease subunit [unclassified Tsukamurella]MDF0528420.1 DHA2 family efflux MFS transporter permease subunit [Tsukamurella sp. 8J]MDF0586245.1 DHA2 family efflux MFS transporter permease subunit [Tsukamurella sp. 8F]
MDTPARRIAGIVALGSLMTMFDTTVTAIATPALTRALHADLPTVAWVTTAYMLALVAVMPTAAWAVARFGDRRTYLAALGLFLAGSAAAGLAWSVGSLIGFRALQGVGGGLLAPVGMAVTLRSVTDENRGRVMAVFGLPLFVGPVLGPTLGGALVDGVGWRSLFFLNIPIGLAALVLAARYLPPNDRRAASPLDIRGLLTLSPGAVLVVFGLSRLGTDGDPTSPSVLAPAAAGLALIGTFVAHALRTPHPLLDLRLIAHPPLRAALRTLAPFTAAYFGSMLALPVYVQQARGDSATLAGTLTIGQALASAVALQVATRLADRIGTRRVVLVGVSTGLAGFASVGLCAAASAPYPAIAAVSVLIGIGAGSTMMPLIAGSTRGLAPDRVAGASTLINTNSQLFSALGAAILATVMTSTAGGAHHTPGSVGLAYLVPVALAGVALASALRLPSPARKRVTVPS